MPKREMGLNEGDEMIEATVLGPVHDGIMTSWAINFSRGKKQVTKHIAISRLGKYIPASIIKHEIMKRYQEAERDFAYAEYGQKWREHIPQRKEFPDFAKEEMGLFKKIAKEMK